MFYFLLILNNQLYENVTVMQLSAAENLFFLHFVTRGFAHLSTFSKLFNLVILEFNGICTLHSFFIDFCVIDDILYCQLWNRMAYIVLMCH